MDPGALTYLMRQSQLRATKSDELLNPKSGMLGVSGFSSDMREILDAMKRGHSRAKLAFDVYIHRLQSGIGAMVAVLGGLDVLVFSAGVGENSRDVRAAACSNLEVLGLKLDAVAAK